MKMRTLEKIFTTMNVVTQMAYNRAIKAMERISSKLENRNCLTPNSIVNEPNKRSAFEDAIKQRIAAQYDLVSNYINLKFLPINYNMMPDGTLSSAYTFNTLKHNSRTHVNMEDNIFTIKQGKMGGGKSQSVFNDIYEIFLNNMLVDKHKLPSRLKVGGLFFDSKMELQIEAYRLAKKAGYLDKDGKPMVKLVSAMPVMVDDELVMQTPVDLINKMTPTQWGKMMVDILISLSGDTKKDFWKGRGGAKIIATVHLGAFITYTMGKKPTVNRWLGYYGNPVDVLEELKEQLAVLTKKSQMDVFLHYYMFEDGMPHFVDKIKAAWEEKLQDVIPWSHMHYFFMSEYSNRQMSKVYTDEKVQKIREYVEAHIDLVDSAISIMERKHMEEVSMNNAETIAKAIRALQKHIGMTETTKGGIEATEEDMISGLLNDPVIAPWLECETGVTGADTCQGAWIALFLDGNKYPDTNKIVMKILKYQQNSECLRRTSNWVNMEGHTYALEVVDEEASTGVTQDDITISSQARGIGKRKISACQTISQYFNTLGDDAARGYLMQFTNIFIFDCDHITKKFWTDRFGTSFFVDNLRDGQDIPVMVDTKSISVASDNGRAFDRSRNLSNPENQSRILEENGSKTLRLRAIYNENYENDIKYTKDFKAFVYTRESKLTVYEWCDFIPPFNIEKYLEEQANKYGKAKQII